MAEDQTLKDINIFADESRVEHWNTLLDIEIMNVRYVLCVQSKWFRNKKEESQNHHIGLITDLSSFPFLYFLTL
jgi:hypothetical protein